MSGFVWQSTLAKAPVVARPQDGGLDISLYAIPHLTDPSVLKVPFHFQVPPLDSFSRSYAFDFSTYQTLSEGEMAAPQGRRLTTITFQAVFLSYDLNTNWSFAYVNRGAGTDTPPPRPGFTNPMASTRTLIRLLESGTPFGFTAHNHPLYGSADVSMGPANGNAAILTALDVEERAGEPDARYSNVSFQEYRDPKLHRRKKGNGKNRSDNRGRNLPVTLVIDVNGRAGERDGERDADKGPVIEGATLRKIAKRYYGEQSLWRDLAKANGITNFTGDRNLGELVKRRKDKTMKLRVPKPQLAAEWSSGRGRAPGSLES